MYCSKCDCRMDIEASYCPRCGAALKEKPLEANEFREMQFRIKRLERYETTWNIAGFISIVAGLLIGMLTSKAAWVSGIFFSIAAVCSIALLIYEANIRKCKRKLMLLWYPPDVTSNRIERKGDSPK